MSSTRSAAVPVPDYTTGEGLRVLLRLLEEAGPPAWRTHPLAAELMEYALEKYMPLARSWRRDPADAMAEAFLAMRSPSVARAADPWAAVTRAVELGIAAEVHAERLLTSADKARRPQFRPDDDPVRAGHYEDFFYHILTAPTPPSPPTVRVDKVVRTATTFLVMTGWHPTTIEAAVDYICHRLTTLANTRSGLDVLRKDDAGRVRLGFTPKAWTGLLRLLLGPRSKVPETAGDWTRLGIFARILLGDTVNDLTSDSELTARSQRLAVRQQ